jgi:hypothetical protein
MRWAVYCLAAWVGLRLLAFGLLAFSTPSFFDDTMDNWNMRGKLFFYEERFQLSFPWDALPGVSSYPATVPLAKTWISTVAGTWSEGLANGMHVAWFLSLLLFVYCTLRRLLPHPWPLLAATILASLPLELIQGTAAYADVFLSAHVCAAIVFLFHALRTKSQNAPAYLRLSALALAAVPLTKNEGWALYFPVLCALFAGTLFLLRRRLMRREIVSALLIAIACICVLTVPWIAFKLMHGLPFGNAKSIDWHLSWYPEALVSILVNTFFEGNWHLLFVLLFALLALRWRTAVSSPLVLLTGMFLIPYAGQLFLYLTTGLSQEALFQTGYARGLIHLMPVIVMLTVLLLYDLLYGLPEEQS